MATRQASTKTQAKKTARRKPQLPKRFRLLNLAQLLLKSPYGVSFKEIVQLEGYNDLSLEKNKESLTLRRRFQRDKRELEELGITIEQLSQAADDGRGDLFRVARASTLIEHIELDPAERLLLDEVIDSYRSQGSEKLRDLLMSAAIKLKSGAGSEGFAEHAPRTQVKRALATQPTDTTRLDVCLEARARRLPLEFTYRSANETKARTRRVEAWGIVRRAAFCYLVGRDQESKERRVFRLSRMRGNPKILEDAKPFKVPKSFVLEDEFSPTVLSGGGRAIAKVGIRFDADVGFIAANDFKGIYPMMEHKDGSLTMTIPSAYPGELFRYLSEFAGHFRIFTPSAMKRDFQARLEEVLSVYE